MTEEQRQIQQLAGRVEALEDAISALLSSLTGPSLMHDPLRVQLNGLREHRQVGGYSSPFHDEYKKTLTRFINSPRLQPRS